MQILICLSSLLVLAQEHPNFFFLQKISMNVYIHMLINILNNYYFKKYFKNQIPDGKLYAINRLSSNQNVLHMLLRIVNEAKCNVFK